MELWYTDKHTEDVNFSIKVKRQLASHKSEIQQIDILDTYGFGRVLILDDFLATGAALAGLKALCGQAGATVVGAGILIEKVFQGGGDRLRAEGLRIESLAKIASMSDDSLVFCE